MRMSARALVPSRAVLAAVTVLVLSLVGLVVAQQQKSREQQKLDKTLTQEAQALAKAVSDVVAGQPAPTDIPIAWRNDYMKSREQRTFVPYMVSVEPGKIQAPAVALYVRAVRREPAAAAAAQVPPKDDKKKEQKPDQQPAEFAWEDVHFQTVTGGPNEAFRLMRAMSLAAGDYDLWVALREQRSLGAEKSKQAGPPRTTIVKQSITVPDYWANGLATSSVIVAEKIDILSAAPTEAELVTKPYALNTLLPLPALTNRFTKKDSLSLLFLVYNTGVDATTKKPDVTIEYNFNQKVDGGEKFFNNTKPQEYNAATLPPHFDSALGHQLMGGQEVPLASFPAGDFRLEIKVTDKVSKKVLTHNVLFTVLP